jgi:hypothetical protein
VYVKMYAINEVKNEFERDRIINGVTPQAFEAARAEARLDADHDGDMLADLHSETGDILDVLVFSRQMRERVVAKLKPTN